MLVIPAIEATVTILPDPRFSISWPAERQQAHNPRRSTAMTRSHSESDNSSLGIQPWNIPALATSTSGGPIARAQWSIADSTARGSDTSQGMASGGFLDDAAEISWATALSESLSRPAPVTTATAPDRSSSARPAEMADHPASTLLRVRKPGRT